MDKRSDDGPRTPLERIKAEHEAKRMQILHNDEDELDWSEDVMPHQVGLKQVWADENGKLWVMVRENDKLKLRRIWTIT